MVFVKGHPNYNIVVSEETKEKIRISKLGNKNPRYGLTPWNKGKSHLKNEKNGSWKGNKVKPLCLHVWVRNHFMKSGICEHCKNCIKTEWSNKDHKYRSRERSAWQELCRSCHLIYDYRVLGRTRDRKSSG